MAATPVYSLRYREPGDSPDIAAATKELALDAEGQIKRVDGNLAALSGLTWIGFTPKLWRAMATTPVEVAGTVTYARYAQLGKLVWATANVTLGAAAAGGVGIDLPKPAAYRNLNAGSLRLMGTAAPSDQSGVAYMASDMTRIVVVRDTNSFLDGASGQLVRYTVMYEAA